MAVVARQLAVASSPQVEQVAQESLLDLGSASGAVLAAYFGAVATDAGVFLSPLSVLTGGVGAGVRAFDGRLRQPGANAKRPRGFQANDLIPAAAYVAVPTGLHATLVALAYDPELSVSRVLQKAIGIARKAAVAPREALLERIKAAGAKAIAEAGFAHPLVAVASPSEGGMLTLSDLNQIPEVDHRAVLKATSAGVAVWSAPWSTDGSGVVRGSMRTEAIAAVDARGRIAVLSYGVVEDGIAVDELALKAPYAANPVQRSVTRTPVGTFLPAPAPIEIHVDENGVPSTAVAMLSRNAEGRARGFELTRSQDGRRVEVRRI